MHCQFQSQRFFRAGSLAILLTLLSACAGSGDSSPLLRAEPAIGADLSRAPRTLRLYFSALPDVSVSSVELTDASGRAYNLRGLHTMAADDLMIEILDALQAGEYTVGWTTRVGDDPAIYSGSFGFTVMP